MFLSAGACVKCDKERKGGEDLMSTEKRLATLRGLSAQAYLLQDDYEDPIMDAIMLSRELEKCRNLEPAMAVNAKGFYSPLLFLFKNRSFRINMKKLDRV